MLLSEVVWQAEGLLASNTEVSNGDASAKKKPPCGGAGWLFPVGRCIGS
jgi:hypothetical protein